jgi:hypothetical protein
MYKNMTEKVQKLYSQNVQGRKIEEILISY